MKIETALTCPVCDRESNGGTRFQPVRQHLKWDLLRCSECSFEFWYPLTQATQQFFEETYRDSADVSVRPSLGLRHRLTLSHMPIKEGAILDIGCGDSLFLSEAHKRGFDVWGVDFNRRVIEKDKALLHLNNLFPMSIYEFARQADIPKFDLVTFFEVLEHMEDPKRFIATIRNLLKEKAFVAFCLPDSNTFGPCERKLNTAPYHTAYWTDKTVRAFLAKNDFEIVMMKRIHRPDTVMLMMNMLTRIKLIKESSIVSIQQDIEYSMTHQSASYAVRTAVFLLQVLSLPLRELLYVVGRRPVIYVIARRRG